MDNEITINGEVYVRKTKKCLEGHHEIAICPKCPNYDQKYFEGVPEKPWPQEGDEYWFVDHLGRIISDFYFFIGSNAEERVELQRFGNFFQTREEAEMYSLRVESLGKEKKLRDGKDFWIWDFRLNHPSEGNSPSFYEAYMTVPIFNTKQECQEWGEKYAKAWLYLYNQ